MKKNLCSFLADAKSNRHGQAMIEFTLILLVIVFLSAGVMDLARGVYAYGIIANAARDGAHYGALDPTNTEEITKHTLGKAAGLEQDHLTILPQCKFNPDNSYIPMFPDDPDFAAYVAEHDGYDDWVWEQVCHPWNYLRVSVWYEFQPVTPIFPVINMVSQSEMIIE